MEVTHIKKKKKKVNYRVEEEDQYYEYEQNCLTFQHVKIHETVTSIVFTNCSLD